MTYKLKFFKSAHKEWQKLDSDVQKQFKAHLKNRLENPHVESARLRGYPNLYKIKLRSIGYRLGYLVEDKEISVYVICVGRRDKIYEILHRRLNTPIKPIEEMKGYLKGREIEYAREKKSGKLKTSKSLIDIHPLRGDPTNG